MQFMKGTTVINSVFMLNCKIPNFDDHDLPKSVRFATF